MNQNLIPVTEDVVYVNADIPVTNSLLIAKYFERDHFDVIKSIRKRIANYSESFTDRNFTVSEYKDSTGRHLKMYELTRDGFWAVVMGFIGEKAAKLQELFIEEFNRRGQIIAEMQRRLPELPTRKNKHRFGYFQVTDMDDGSTKIEFKEGRKTIKEMTEAENSARLHYKMGLAGGWKPAQSDNESSRHRPIQV